MMSEKTNNYKARLIHLITGLDENELKKATYQSIELAINKKNDKVYKTDIIATINKHILSIEMNKDYYKAILIKNSDYRSKLISESLKSGESYKSQKQVIQINFDNYSRYRGNKIIYEFKMLDKDTQEEEYPGSSISYHIDLEKLKSYNEDSELINLLRLFISENVEELGGSKEMDEAIEELERISQDENIIGLYDAEIMQEKMENSIKDEIMDEGINQSKIEIAKKMLNENEPIDKIMLYTGLSVEQVNKLQKD